MAKRRYFLLIDQDGKRFPRLDTKGWAFVVVLGVLLAVLALVDRGSLDPDPAAARAENAGGCQVEVTVDGLSLRAGPAEAAELLGTADDGQVLDGTTTVTDGYRELADGSWAFDESLTPVPGTVCG